MGSRVALPLFLSFLLTPVVAVWSMFCTFFGPRNLDRGTCLNAHHNLSKHNVLHADFHIQNFLQGCLQSWISSHLLPQNPPLFLLFGLNLLNHHVWLGQILSYLQYWNCSAPAECLRWCVNAEASADRNEWNKTSFSNLKSIFSFLYSSKVVEVSSKFRRNHYLRCEHQIVYIPLRKHSRERWLQWIIWESISMSIRFVTCLIIHVFRYLV